MASRRRDRRAAVDILYQADVTHADAAGVLEEWERADREVASYTRTLVLGVTERIDELDGILERHSQGWRVDRMPSLDRTILRVATFELAFGTDVPVGVAIDEAVRAAKELSTEDSGRFVNGVLGTVASEIAGGR